jgi:Tic22-like family
MTTMKSNHHRTGILFISTSFLFLTAHAFNHHHHYYQSGSSRSSQLVVWPSSSRPVALTSQYRRDNSRMSNYNDDRGIDDDVHDDNHDDDPTIHINLFGYSSSRRQILQRTVVAVSSAVVKTTPAWAMQIDAQGALTATTTSTSSTTSSQSSSPTNQQKPPPQSSSDGLMSASDVAKLLHTVPTFCIVDEKGVPFFVVGEDAKLTSYFFTTYGEASRILKLAKESSDRAIRDAKVDPTMSEQQKQELGDNPWNTARISTVPLDTAITLVSKSTKSLYFKVVPAEDDINDALSLTGDDDLSEGKVPLFYYEDLTLPVNGGDGDDGSQQQQQTPLYFRKSELEQEYRRQQQQQQQRKKKSKKDRDDDDVDVVLLPETPPPIKVSELFSVCQEMVKPGGTDEDLLHLVFVPPKESNVKQKECLRKGGKQPAFVIGQRIIVL